VLCSDWSGDIEVESIPIDALDRIAEQLLVLNMLFSAYLVCKGVGYATRIVMRRDPPKRESIRPRAARSDGS
jgi:hypothetical protein